MIRRPPPPPEAGVDRVEMLFSANPGEEPRPLRKIASGGELSRVTLAVKTVLAARRPRADAGLRRDRHGRRRPARLGAGQDAGGAGPAPSGDLRDPPAPDGQLCRSPVGHPQGGRAGRSRTTITPLDEAERVDELAAMLRGDSAAEGTRKEAIAMLAEAQGRK